MTVGAWALHAGICSVRVRPFVCCCSCRPLPVALALAAARIIVGTAWPSGRQQHHYTYGLRWYDACLSVITRAATIKITRAPTLPVLCRIDMQCRAMGGSPHMHRLIGVCGWSLLASVVGAGGANVPVIWLPFVQCVSQVALPDVWCWQRFVLQSHAHSWCSAPWDVSAVRMTHRKEQPTSQHAAVRDDKPF